MQGTKSCSCSLVELYPIISLDQLLVYVCIANCSVGNVRNKLQLVVAVQPSTILNLF